MSNCYLGCNLVGIETRQQQQPCSLCHELRHGLKGETKKANIMYQTPVTLFVLITKGKLQKQYILNSKEKKMSTQLPDLAAMG